MLVYGDFNKNLSFEVGDVDLIMTPFTLWNNYEEGNIHESHVISHFNHYSQGSFHIVGNGNLQNANNNYPSIYGNYYRGVKNQ